MTLAVLADCQKILNQLLNRNRTAWSATGGTGANKLGTYPFDEEIEFALLRADGLVITEGYFKSRSASLRSRFWLSSGNLATGTVMPEFSGIVGKAEWSANGTTGWTPSIKQDNDEDILGLSAYGNNRTPTNSVALAEGMHRFGNDGYVYHGSPFFRFYYPSYTRTGALQCLQQHENLIVTWAAELLYKENAQVAVDSYRKTRGELLERLIAGELFMPPQQRNVSNDGGN